MLGIPALPLGLPGVPSTVMVPRHAQRPGPIAAGQGRGQGGNPLSCVHVSECSAASQCPHISW